MFTAVVNVLKYPWMAFTSFGTEICHHSCVTTHDISRVIGSTPAVRDIPVGIQASLNIPRNSDDLRTSSSIFM
jgi:hypothetical protein